MTRDEETGIEYEFELRTPEDQPNVIILHFGASEPVTPDEYFTFLRDYIYHMETLVQFKETSGQFN